MPGISALQDAMATATPAAKAKAKGKGKKKKNGDGEEPDEEGQSKKARLPNKDVQSLSRWSQRLRCRRRPSCWTRC